MKNFTMRDEEFICENCQKKVSPLGYTARDHCPYCLYSKHVDINPGDRLSNCGGLMKPVEIQQKNGEFIILHKCEKCGFLNSKFDEIVEFSGLEKFINVPLKNYSSGMKSRLGFAIATVVEPDVLILDEVLSVGDAKFRKKSENKVTEMFDKGVTVLFVSHNTAQVRRLCTKAILLDHGKIIANGDVNEVCDIYDKKVNGK